MSEYQKMICECPNCHQLQYQAVIDNDEKMYGAGIHCEISEVFLDGSRVNSGLHGSDLNICPTCETNFFYSKVLAIDPSKLCDEDIISMESIATSKLPTMDDYHFVAKKYPFQDSKEELEFRYKIKSLYVSRNSFREPMFTSEKDKENWKNIISGIIICLDPDDMDDRLEMAELYRIIGEFEKCNEMLPGKTEKISYKQRLKKVKIKRNCEALNSKPVISGGYCFSWSPCMKIILFVVTFPLFILNCIAQTDTVFTNNEKISCTVKEVTQDAVKFSYPGEEIINTVYKNTVQKIIFKSGRVQSFAESTSYKTVNGATDFENVSITIVQSEVNGLFKLGDINSMEKGSTNLSTTERVNERAYIRMKIVAAMMGANIIYLTQNTTIGNQIGSTYQVGHVAETNLSGVAYSNKIPSFDDFIKLIGSKTKFICFELYKMSQRYTYMSRKKCSKNVNILKIYNESGLIMINAKIDGVDSDTFRVISYNSDVFTLVYKDGLKIYNYNIRF